MSDLKPWTAARLCDESGEPMRGESAVAYVTTCVRAGGDRDFYAVLTTADDGKPADVCHTGNGPNSRRNAERIAALPQLEAENIDLCHEWAQWREKWTATLDTMGNNTERYLHETEASRERVKALESDLAQSEAIVKELEGESVSRMAAERALRALLHEPHGCRFCDSGKLRVPGKPEKDHDPDCGFFLAQKYLAPSAERGIRETGEGER